MNINDLKEARLNANLSQRIFCEITGVPLGSLRNWEQGLSTPPEYVVSLLVDKVNEYVRENERLPHKFYYVSKHLNNKIYFVLVTKDDFFSLIDKICENNDIKKFSYDYEFYSEEHYYSDTKEVQHHIGYIKTYGV